MNWIKSLLFAGFLFTFSAERVVFAQDWLSTLLADVGNINEKVQSQVSKINEQVHREVNTNLGNQLQNINEQVREQVAAAQKEAAKAVKEGRTSPSQSIIVSGNTASSRSYRNGVDANGKPYQVESEDLVIGKTLIHTTRIYNSTTKTIEEQRYTLDLSDPNAKPVYANVTQLPYNP